MDEIIKEFNDLVEEMAQAISEIDDPKEIEKKQKFYDNKIDVAEKKMEKDMEKFLEDEQKALEELEASLTDEVTYDQELIENISKAYKRSELKEILTSQGIKDISKLKEIDLIKLIIDYEFLNLLTKI